MIDAGLLPLLRCPRSHQPLVIDDDAETLRRLNDDVSAGKTVLASGKSPAEPVEAVLRTEDAAFRYPVIGGIPFLLAESVLRDAEEGEEPAETSFRMTDDQRRLMEKYSLLYDGWYHDVTRGLQSILQERYYPRFEGRTVLDVGNGGTPPEIQLGADMAKKVGRFIALDNSAAMLTRNGLFGNQILADSACLPLTDDAVDYVLVNNVLHHFGLTRGQNPLDRLGHFFREALRVSRKGVIVNELIIPKPAEWVEKGVLQVVKSMPTFVFSESFYRQLFRRFGLDVPDFFTVRLSELISPLTVIPPILKHHWLRVPSFVIPYSFAFFSIDKASNRHHAG